MSTKKEKARCKFEYKVGSRVHQCVKEMGHSGLHFWSQEADRDE